MPMSRAVIGRTVRYKQVILLLCLMGVSCGCRRKQVTERINEVRMSDAGRQSRLLRGFYGVTGGWRWTSRVFAVSLDPPQADRGTYLEFDFGLSSELLSEYATVTLVARVNGVEVGRQKYDKVGRYVFASYVPFAALGRKPAEVEFELDHALKDPTDGHLLGANAVSIGLKEYEQTTEYRETQARLAREAYSKLVEERHHQMPPQKERELMKSFHELPVWQNLWFQNVRIIKNPLDLWMMQQIIYEVQPDFIVETGTWYGGSALYWAYTLHGMSLLHSHVLTVDVQDFTPHSASHPLWKKYVEFFRGSSTDPAIVSRIAEKVKGRKTIVTLDSDHSMSHVLQELRMYSPLVSPGSYLIVEDTHLDGLPTHPEQGPGPMAAVRRFLEEGGNRDFERDDSREALVLTFNPGGWLRRK